jgi:hypothetical protein
VISIELAAGSAVVDVLANTAIPPNGGVGFAYDTQAKTVYYEAWDDAAGHNAFVTVDLQGNSSAVLPLMDNIFDFVLTKAAGGKLWGLSDTDGNKEVGEVDRSTGSFTKTNSVGVPAGISLLSGLAFR